jgi:hypothetical protein
MDEDLRLRDIKKPAESHSTSAAALELKACLTFEDRATMHDSQPGWRQLFLTTHILEYVPEYFFCSTGI